MTTNHSGHGVRPMPEITPEQANHRFVEFIPGRPDIVTSRVDPVEPVPVGTYVAMIFRVTGYDPDCDGSLMARMAHVDRTGDPSGWEIDHIGLYPGSEVVLDAPGVLHDLAGAR